MPIITWRGKFWRSVICWDEKVKAKEDQSYAQSAQTVTVSNQGLYSLKLAFAKKNDK